MTNNQKDNIVDRQTIQWARESLQRRRRELQEKKKNLVLQYGGREDDVSLSQSPTTSQQTREEETAAPSAAAITTSDDDDVVNTILEKGRTLLGTAEAHTEILGRYANANNNANTADTKDAVENDDNDTSPNDHKLNFDNVNLPVEAPDLEKDDDGSSEQQSIYLENDEKELQELLPQEGDARARLDELIASVRRQGHHHRSESNNNNNADTPTKKKVSNFDPSAAATAKRAALKKSKLDEEVAAAEAEARALTSFKALPLPGGVEVKNDIFASTASFSQKQLGSVEKLVRRDSKLHDQQHQKKQLSSSTRSQFGDVDEFGSTIFGSMVSSRTGSGPHDNNNSSFDPATCVSTANGGQPDHDHADKERAEQLRAEKKQKKRQLLLAVNQIITSDNNDDDADNNALGDEEEEGEGEEDDVISIFSNGSGLSYDIVEDPSKLRQAVAWLEAKLKQKKTQRLATLNDIVDIDLDALFDRLLSSGSGTDEARDIIDHLKNRVCGSVNDYHVVSHDESNANNVESDDDGSHYERMSLFSRQEAWARQRDQKLFEARIQLETDTMHGITGRPEVSHASRSWKKAKETHDVTLKKCVVDEERKQQEKKAREMITNELKRKEMEELQMKADEMKLQNKSTLDTKNKEEQMKRLGILSRPRQIREVHSSIVLTDDEAVDGPQKKISTDNITSKTYNSLGGSNQQTQIKKKITGGGGRAVSTSTYVTNRQPLFAKNSNINNIAISDKPPSIFCGKSSFSEMTDKEFNKMIQRIERNAKMVGRSCDGEDEKLVIDEPL